MKRLFLFIGFIFLFSSLSAHTHKVSSMFLIKEGDVWNVQLSASFTAYQYEMLKEMTKEEIKELSPEDIQKWIGNHIENNLSLYINDEKINFGQSYIQLGHEIKSKILLENAPAKIDAIVVENTCFLNSGSSHKSFFKVVLDKNVSERFKMVSANQHRIELDVYDNKAVPAGYVFKKIKKAALPITLGLTGIILAVSLLFKLKQRKITLVV